MKTIVAQLAGCDTCIACGRSVRADAPVLQLCRVLLTAGEPADAKMEVFRGSTLALHVRSIGEAARLEISGNRFASRAKRTTRASSNR